jgi:hypothetical protein
VGNGQNAWKRGGQDERQPDRHPGAGFDAATSALD